MTDRTPHLPAADPDDRRPPGGRGLSRRDLLRGSAYAAVGVAAATTVGACTTSGADDAPTAAAAQPSGTGATAGGTGTGGTGAPGTGDGDLTALRGKRVGLVGVALSSEAVNRVRVEAERIGRSNGIDLQVVDTNGDYGRASDTLELWASQDFAAVISDVVDPNLMTEGAQALAAKRIPFGGVFAGNGPGLSFDVTSNEWISGTRIGTYVTQRIASGASKGGIAILTYSPIPAVKVRELAMTALASYNNVPVVARQELKVPGQVPDAQQKVNDLLTRFPTGQLACIWCGWDEVANAASQAVKQAGRSDVFVTGIDGNQDSFTAIRAGDPMAATCANDMEAITKICFQQLSRMVGGGQPAAATLYVDAPFVAKQNLPASGYPAGAGLTTFYQA